MGLLVLVLVLRQRWSAVALLTADTVRVAGGVAVCSALGGLWNQQNRWGRTDFTRREYFNLTE
eukprot:gene3700-5048_t